MGNTIKTGTSNNHDKTQKTEITVSAYYTVHPDDRQIFIDAVIRMTAEWEMELDKIEKGQLNAVYQ